MGTFAVGVGVDVTDPEAVAALAERAVSPFGKIVWVNNAGIYGATPLFDGPDVFDRCVDVNLRGVFVGAREAARYMTRAGNGGSIINVASSAAFRAIAPESEPDCATKAGVVGLTRALAVSLDASLTIGPA
jgi:NAD(P)-dependent dehydrogenase (short-subunit alcohol dehydrogenase family)